MKKPAILAAALLPLAAAVAAPAPQGHPHFDDGGTIQWQTKLPDAKAAAKAATKLILIEYGRAT